MSEALLISVGKGIESVRVKKGKSKIGPNRDICGVFLTLTADVNQRDF